SWMAEWEVASRFYSRIEARLGTRFLHVQPSVRWFASEDEKELWQQRMRNGDYAGLDVRYVPGRDDGTIFAPYGGFEMFPSARLDTVTYLAATREYFCERGAYVQHELDLSGLVPSLEGVRVPALDIICQGVLFCQGHLGRSNPWFPHVDFRPAKGEILTLSIEEYEELRTQHFDVWLAPKEAGTFRAGSNYEWNQLDELPTERVRNELLQRLSGSFRVPVEVLNHQAGIRPAVSDSRPVVGFHPTHPQLMILNGLGAKGTLWAPLASSLLLAFIADGEQIPAEWSVNRFECRGGS
ncbi:MAG: FAD-binding oxidoreductase, partial [Planctomycetaceae bacterium]|nr:FAD-binding oxidoreductase [Planctomycetaceae bacterium]